MASDLDQLQQRIAALSPAKRALFEQRLQQVTQQVAPHKQPTIPRSGVAAISVAQQRLWFLHQLDPESPAYNIAILWRFQGVLDRAAVAQSLNAIVQRHESLRTTFSATGVPVIHPALVIALPTVDLQALPNPAAQVESLARQEAQMPFDLTQAPLLRAGLLQLNPTETVLLLTLHHIVADGWSRGILLQEFAAFYKAFQAGQPASLPDLPIQYSDFANWQQSQRQEWEAQLDYWRQQLADLTPLELSVEGAESVEALAADGFQSATQTLTLPESLLNSLKALSRQAGVTLFMTLLTAFKLLLHRYTGADDIAIGVPTANRTLREIETLIGFFVNTLVLRTDLSGNPSFLSLLERVRQVVAAAYKHQDIPFAKLVEDLRPQRHLNHNPIFQVMFQFQNDAYQLQNSLSPDLAIPGLTLTQDWIESGITKFDLTWHLVERSTGLLAVVEYRTALFSAPAVKRMLAHFQVLLVEAVAQPNQRISELSILSAAERQQILIAWNRTQKDIPEQLFHQQFEIQAERSSEQIAVTFQDQVLTYAELNSQANQLAHYLQSVGIQPGVCVGIWMQPSVQLLVGLLGILKAGAAYLPLDPALPAERLSFILQDAQVKLLIADQPCDYGCPCFNLATERQQAKFPTSNPASRLTAADPAYIIYTSGSTGQPKGTLLSHQGLSNYLHWCVQTYISPNAAGAPVQSSIGFDATLTSLYAPLLIGQPVHLLPDPIESLAQRLTSQRYSFVKLTPAHLRLLSQWFTLADHPPILPQTFILGGEALTESDLTFWRTQAPGSRFINEYGPTEATVGCAIYEATYEAVYEATAKTSALAIPIGRPIQNSQLYILDQYLQPVPVGVAGELYIGGCGLAQGYLNQPELTAARFIPNPYSSSPEGSRLYKTGDRARCLADGAVVYLGRFDQQVKLYGHRIELEEIAARLKQHPAIRDAVVRLARDHNGNSRLVAYLVASMSDSVSTSIPAPAQLRQFLNQTLPDYMLPALYMTLSAIPLTANGKVDRRALPAPNWTALSAELSLAMPPTGIEAKLAQIWSEVLGVPAGIHDNFFELGGDSILSLQIIARANQADLKLTPRQLFQYQTIAELASVAQSGFPAECLAAEQGLVMGSVPLTPIQHWFFEQNLPEPHHFNQAILLEVEAGLDFGLLQQAFQKLQRHHDALRLRFLQDESGWRQVHAEVEELLEFGVIDLSQLSYELQVQGIEAAANALQGSLDLSEILWRGILFRLSSQTDRLLLISHHLIIDSLSWQILLSDLVTSYRQAPLPPKTTAFRDWSEQLVAYAKSDQPRRELAFWLEQSGASLPTDYPTDYPADLSLSTVAASAQVLVKLEIETTQAFTRFTQTNRAQSEEILLSALLIAFNQWTNSSKLLIDLELHGRDNQFTQIDISRTVGWFTAIFPVLLDLASASSTQSAFQVALQSVKQQLKSFPSQGIHYGILRYLNQLKNLPQAEVKFNYLGAIDRVAESFVLGFAQESTGRSISLSAQRRYLLEINGWISEQQLHLSWTYSRHLHQRSTVERLAQRCLEALRLLVQDKPSYMATDFPAARLDQKQLDQLVAKIQQSGRK